MVELLLVAIVGLLGWLGRGLWNDLRPMSDAEIDESLRRAEITRATNQWEDDCLRRMLQVPTDLHEECFSAQELAAGERAALRKRLTEEAARRAAKETKR